jgi:DNA-binding transcriptional MerR regulator
VSQRKGPPVPEAFEPLGITYRQLDFWCRRGYLRPVTGGRGSGFPRWYPPEEVEVARCMVALIRDGVRVEVAAKRAREALGVAP